MRAPLLLLAASAVLLCGQTAFGQHMMMPGAAGIIQVSPNMSHPCYQDPSAPSCELFRRTHADVMTDRTSLCAAMDFMVGCTLMHECTNGTADASSVYCKPWSHVAAICIDMPRMKGCEAWAALCGKNVSGTTVVDMCTNPPPIPDVLTTQEAKDAVVALCTAEPSLDGCATCDFSKPGWTMCDDYLTTLSLLCQEMPDDGNCSRLRGMCGGEGVAAAFPEICAFVD